VPRCPTDSHLTPFHADVLVLYTFFGPDLSNNQYTDNPAPPGAQCFEQS